MITIIKTDWQHHQTELTALREEVFIKEQHISLADEWDGRDNDATHFLVFDEQQAIACARLLGKNRTAKIGRVAVLPGFRHQKIATRLLQFIIADAQLNSFTLLECDAQTYITTLYERLGFEPCGETFWDAGILHQAMQLRLTGLQDDSH